MAQLRRDYFKFKALDTEVLVVLPNGPVMIKRYRATHVTPYPVLTDRGAKVMKQYGIELHRFVVMTALPPTVLLVDRAGKIRYTNYQRSYVLEPDNNEPLAVLEGMKV